MFSVVTIVYNEVDYIEDTIKSVISQSCSDVEYIIIDGGSTDGTLDVIRKYESDISFWETGNDTGISNAFNRGVQKATGDYISFLNAGDWYAPTTIATIAASATQYPEVDIFYGDIAMVDEDRAIKYARHAAPTLKSDSFRFRMPSVPHPTVFARYECCEEQPFDESLHNAMDYEWLRRLMTMGATFKRLAVNSPFVYMRLAGKSNDGYLRTLAEVHEIAIHYGDPWVLSFVYNRIFRASRFILRRALERTRAGEIAVDLIRRVTVVLGWRRWELK